MNKGTKDRNRENAREWHQVRSSLVWSVTTTTTTSYRHGAGSSSRLLLQFLSFFGKIVHIEPPHTHDVSKMGKSVVARSQQQQQDQELQQLVALDSVSKKTFLTLSLFVCASRQSESLYEQFS